MASPWLVLGEYIVSLISQAFCLYVFSYIVLKRLKNNVNFNATIIKSPCINFYFYTQICTAIVNITFIIFFMINWRPYTTENNSYLLFFIGGTQLLFIILSPFSTFVLGLDRILCVWYPTTYTYRQNVYPRYLGILLMLIAACFAFTVIIIPSFPKKDVTSCSVFGCLVAKEIVEIYLFARGFTGILVFGNCIALVAVMKCRYNYTHRDNKFNTVVFYTLVATLLLDFFPNLGGTVFTSLSGINLQALLGPYSTVSACIETGICAYFFQKVFKKTLNTAKIITPYFA